MADQVCAKCRRRMLDSSRRFRCTSCGAWFCPSCMDRHCLFCRAAVSEVPPGR